MTIQSPNLLSTRAHSYPQCNICHEKEPTLWAKITALVTAPLQAIGALFLGMIRGIKSGAIWMIWGRLQMQYSQLLDLHQPLDPSLFSEAAKYPHRNRYGNVLPNEPTRFKIANDPKFYFNANWVLNSQAIACQGPLDKEIDEFWKMVWHADVQSIVMLTNPCEKGRDKCSEYWKTMDFEEETVFTRGDEAIIKRTIHLSGWFQSKTVVQYHLQNWPDHGIVCPETLSTLIKLVAQENGKILAHCSAGIGRTGTFLAAYEAYRQKRSDIYSIAADLRDPEKGRVGMIQTFEQYQLAQQAAEKVILDLK